MAGLGLVLLGVILIQVAETFFFYPAQSKVNSALTYWSLKTIGYFLFGIGAVTIVMGFL